MRRTLAVIGSGVLANHVLYILSHRTGYDRIVLCARDVERATRLVNTLRQHAVNIGHDIDIAACHLDLDEADQSCETLRNLAPDVIFNTASMQSWWVVTRLPEGLREQVALTRFGPWLPLHLSPTIKLMQILAAAEIDPTVVNAAFPDAVHPALAAVGLSPHIGIGNIANVVPALRLAVADALDRCVRDTDVRICAHHFVSYRLSRLGNPDGAPLIFHASVNGSDVTDLIDQNRIFEALTNRHRRTGGIEGQPVTASSAVAVLEALLSPQKTLVHTPGPNGLPGGYPMWLSQSERIISLPEGVSLDQAIKANEGGQICDGIDKIDDHGTIHFAAQQQAVMKDVIGYDCHSLPVSDAHDAARELSQKYTNFLQRNGLAH